jgi:AsmA protein
MPYWKLPFVKKWSTVIILGIAVAVLIAALVSVPRYINSLKPQIEQAVQQVTGRSFRLGGDLRMRWFPSIGIELGATQLGNASDFGDAPFAEVDRANIRVAMVPLLRGQIEVQTLQLKGLKLNLAVDKQGRGNWQDLIGASASRAPQQGPHHPALSLAGIEVEEAALHWHDFRTGAQVSLAPFRLNTGAVVMGQPVDFALQFAMSNRAPAFGGQVHFKARAHYEPQLEQIHFQGIDVEVTDAFVDGLPFTGVRGRIDGAVLVDMKKQLLNLPSLHAVLRGEHLRGPQVQLDLRARGVLQLEPQRFMLESLEIRLRADPQPGMQADLVLQGRGYLDLLKQQYRLEDAVLNIAVQGGHVGDKSVNGVLKTTLDADLGAQTASMKPLHLEGVGMQLDGYIKVEYMQASPRVNGTIKIPPFSPRETLNALNLRIPETSPKDVLEAGALVVDFEVSPRGITLPRVLMAVDKSQVNAKLRVENFAKPDLVFLLNVNTLDVDRYMTLLGEAPRREVPHQKVAREASEEIIDLPIESLHNMSVRGLVEIDALKVAGMRMKEFSATLIGNDGVIEIKPLRLALYGGSLRSSTRLDVREAPPAYQLYARAENIRLGELLKDAVGEESAYVEGISTVKMKVSTRGDRPSRLKRQLHGDIELNIERGKLHDKKFAEKLETLAAIIEKRAARAPEEVVVFDHLGATWKAEQGVLRNDDLRLNTLLLDFRGEGEIHLPDAHIAYSLYPVISGERQDMLLAPITIKGALNDPQYGLDLTRFARERLRHGTTHLGEGFKDQTERLGKGIKALTGGIKHQLDSGVEAIKGIIKREESR